MINLIETLKEQGVSSSSAMISETLFDGDSKLTLECEPVERGKVLILAKNCSCTLHRAEIKLNRPDDRAKFVKALPEFDESQRKQIGQALLRLADELDLIPPMNAGEHTGKILEKAIYKALPDGRIIEQIGGAVFAVYDPKSEDLTYTSRIETDEAIYQPLDDDFVLRGGLSLPDRPIEYGSDHTLDAEIEACIRRYSDAPERELKLSAKYARLSYIADKLNEISYLRATGERGSGKSRFIGTLGMICLRPILVTSPSAASLYRMLDAYQPTLIIDECNFEQGSEDATALMQVLNCGFQRLTYVPRIDRGADGQMTLRMFSAFGPKLIGSLKLSDSAAFESRCVSVALRKTQRKDITFRLTEQMLRDFAELRAKLYMWRLKNWHRNYEEALDEAERELKNYQIEPRFIQIAIPLYGMLAEDRKLKADLARMLEGRTDDARSDKKDSFDGQIVSIIHGLLFDTEDEEGERKSIWRKTDSLFKPEEGKPLDTVTIERITEQVNNDLPEKKKHDSRWIGKQVVKLGFRRTEITSRQSANRKKSAVIFDPHVFTGIFTSFGLPLPGDFHPATPDQSTNLNQNKPLDRPDEEKKETPIPITSGRLNSLLTEEIQHRPDVAGCKTRVEGEEAISEAPGEAREVIEI